VLLDIEFKNQPLDGFEICESIRLNDKKIPIILITAYYTETEDVLKGFKLGISDYVSRPRDNREIIARIRANLPPEVVLVDDFLCVDLARCQVLTKRTGTWQETDLQGMLFKLLEDFINNAGLIRLTTTLMAILWGDADRTVGALWVLVDRLREIIEPDPRHPVYIETIKGLGYRFNGKPVSISRQAFDKLVGDS
jgi:DNA-binding response OmpR family regulator